MAALSVYNLIKGEKAGENLSGMMENRRKSDFPHIAEIRENVFILVTENRQRGIFPA